ncbi:MAG TPA: MBL fold metallo-hydrolase, partial [Dehalococcoidales bacterium]|nr:MBL fold metallo-hydrolase [Dehalococcoidales bacterium]
SFSYIADSRFFDGLTTQYLSDVLIINVVFVDNRLKMDHLSAIDVESIVTRIKPKAAILTHFGMQLWHAGPAKTAASLTEKTGIRIIAAQDGMVFDLDSVSPV